jgi:plastocyanin
VRAAAGRIVAAMAFPLVVGAGCTATTAGSDAPHPSTTVHEMAGSRGAAGLDGLEKVECAQHMPGDLLTAAEAMVMFDPQHVCLGYVTVRPGTPVMFHNTDTAAHRVTILGGGDVQIAAFDVAGGSAVSRSLTTAGIYRFRLSAIESFVGTIEVIPSSS